MKARLILALGSLLLLAVSAWLGTAEARRPADPPARFWTRVHTAGPLTVYRGEANPAPYLIAVGNQGLVIDAPASPGRETPVSVQTVLLTHHHRDSVAGVEAWTAAKVPVRAPKASSEWLTRENVTRFWKESIPLRTSRTAYFVVAEGVDGLDYSLEDGQTIPFAGYQVSVIATPGHSRDHLAFAVSRPGDPAGPLVFGGDLMTGDGQLWTPFTTDWDHWTDAGLKPAAESLRKVARLKPAVYFPARGPIVTRDAASLLDRAAAAVEEAGFLKSFERFTNRLGNPPQYDFLVPKEQVGSGGDKPWAKVSDHLWITGNTYVLTSREKRACLVVDPWGQRSVDQVERLRRDEKLGPVEVVVFSHAHYDHYDGVYTLPGREGYQVWSLDIVAEPLKDPLRLRAPFLDARPIRFDKIFRDGDTATWREYSLRFHALPGQTAFTSGIEAQIDGKRCFFTADNFFHQNQYSGSGGWMGLNRSSPLSYARSARKVLDAAPEWVLAEHGGPYVFHPEDYRRRILWGEAAAKAADALCVSGQHLRDWNPHRISGEPVLQSAKAGSTVQATIQLSNPGPREETRQIRIESPGLPSQTVSITAKAGQSGAVPITLCLPETLPVGRRLWTVRIAEADEADAFLAVEVTALR